MEQIRHQYSHIIESFQIVIRNLELVIANLRNAADQRNQQLKVRTVSYDIDRERYELIAFDDDLSEYMIISNSLQFDLNT